MKLTKFAHACVSLASEHGALVIDPGALTPNAAELVAGVSTVLFTHEHFDHIDEELMNRALAQRPELRVYGPASMLSRLEGGAEQLHPVAEGDILELEGFSVAVVGRDHAPIHRDMPSVANVGYLVDGRLLHPGDAYYVPQAPVEILLLPTSGPWTKVGEAVDYLRALKPKRVIQIHEILLSEMGQQATANFLGPHMLGEVPVEIVAAGTTITI